jgi:hypothetical protein
MVACLQETWITIGEERATGTDNYEAQVSRMYNSLSQNHMSRWALSKVHALKRLIG